MRSFAQKWYARLTQRGRSPHSAVPLPGLPAGLRLEVLEGVCQRYFSETPEQIVHLHLSSWKPSGTYRLWLQSSSGHRWSLVYKDANYSLEHIPAVVNLPILPGPPEYLIYRQAHIHPHTELAGYLPTVYYCEQAGPHSYRYLLEDLQPDAHRPSTQEEKLRVVGELPALRSAIRVALPAIESLPFLRFDHAFSLALQGYFHHNLTAFLRQTNDPIVAKTLNSWPAIAEMHRREEFHEKQALTPIHGDLNTTNIHLVSNAQHLRKIKLVDWEWAGIGLPHADLASLLKRAKPQTEARALKVFADLNWGLSLPEHVRLYQWCRLERGLLDAAFLAAQWLALPGESQLDLPNHIRAALKRVLDAWQRLASS